MNRKISLLSAAFIFLFSSCALSGRPGNEVKNYFLMSDTEPPILLEVQSVSNNQVRLVFNEEVTPFSNSFEPNITEAEGYSIIVTLTQSVQAGHRIMLEGRVKDYGGNTTGISTPVWGFNNRLPEVVINEFSTRGEGSNPDRTELLVLSDGNLAGAVLYDGIPGSFDSYVVFGSLELKQGDFVVVWWTETLPDGVKNTEHVFNICAETKTNLSGYNGVLTLAESPAQGADVVDCVVYSNGSMTYGGYGSKLTMERAEKAFLRGWWTSEPVNSSDTTATRSFCRNPKTGSWYICVTKGATFGFENTSDSY